MQASLIDLFFSDVLTYYITACLLIILAGLEWLRWYYLSPPNPWLYTIVAAGYTGFAWFKIRRGIKKSKSLRLGRDGEIAVGQYLEQLRGIGAKVFHDIPGENFNIDHIVIHISGIYLIETKTNSKPDRGTPKLIFDGETVSFNGNKPDRNPVVQAKAAALWLEQLLFTTTGKKSGIRPVVVYPGWFIEPTAEARRSSVWVLNPKALPSFIRNSRESLTAEDVNLFSYHLSRYVRTS